LFLQAVIASKAKQSHRTWGLRSLFRAKQGIPEFASAPPRNRFGSCSETHCHCERSEAIWTAALRPQSWDCFVGKNGLLAMTGERFCLHAYRPAVWNSRNDTLAPPWSSGMAGRLLYGPGRSSQTPPITLRALAGFAHHHRSQPALHFLVNALVGLRQCFASKDAALLQHIASRAPQWYNSRAINARGLALFARGCTA